MNQVSNITSSLPILNGCTYASEGGISTATGFPVIFQQCAYNNFPLNYLEETQTAANVNLQQNSYSSYATIPKPYVRVCYYIGIVDSVDNRIYSVRSPWSDVLDIRGTVVS